MLYRRCPRTPGPGILNLKAALGPKPGKVNQQYRHTKVNQHVLADEVPNNTNKNQIPSLGSHLSNHVQSVVSPQYKHQWKCAMRRSSQFAAWRDPNQDQSIYYNFYIYDSHSFCINRIQASNARHLLLLRSKTTISIQYAILRSIVVKFILK